MAKWYGECFQNIDATAKQINIELTDVLRKKVKMLLRRCDKIKDDNTFLLAQHCVYNVIKHSLNISNNSYDHKKILISRVCSKVHNSKEAFIIKLNFTKLINQVSLNEVINIMYQESKMHDSKVIATIKYLLSANNWKDTFLGRQLLNHYLIIFDKWMSVKTDLPSKNFKEDFNRHKNNYIERLHSRGRNISCKYYRYQYEAIIILNTRVEQLEMLSLLNEWNIDIRTDYNKFNFLGFRIIKRKEHGISKIGITPDNPKLIYKMIKNTKWKTHKEILQSLQTLINFLMDYDICNNLSFYLNRLGLRMLKNANRNNSILKKIPNKVQYEYAYKDQKNIIDIYELRQTLKVSYKEYICNPIYLLMRDQMNQLTPFLHGYQIYKYSLWTKQKGKDLITKQLLNPKSIHIHHINGNHFDNRFNNLLLINIKIHRLIHNNVPTINNVQKYRNLLNSKMIKTNN